MALNIKHCPGMEPIFSYNVDLIMYQHNFSTPDVTTYTVVKTAGNCGSRSMFISGYDPFYESQKHFDMR